MAYASSKSKISLGVSKYLDGLGFSRIQIWNRIHEMNIRSKVSDLSIKFSIKTNNERIYIGSKREGLGLSVLSDLDVLQVEHDVLCTKATLTDEDDRILVLKIIDTNTPAGYCQLRVEQPAVNSRTLDKYRYAFDEKNGETYLSSSLFTTKIEDDLLKMSQFAENNSIRQPQHGPSSPRFVPFPFLNSLLFEKKGINFVEINDHYDFVRAFPCDGHAALKTWQTRPRKYNWPSRKLIKHIMTLPVYVIPVGQKGSQNGYLEWRISFVHAEIKLVQSFNNVQMKIFLLLKLVAKHYLNSESEAITSYAIKNVMLWLAEEIPQKKFRQKHLMSRMMDALQMLKDSVMTKTLSNYMQPERNLYENRLDETEEQQLIQRINSLTCEGQAILHDILCDRYRILPYNIQQIVDELKTCNQLTQNEIHTSIDYDIKDRLELSMEVHKLKSEEELIEAITDLSKRRTADEDNPAKRSDTYCSRKLIDAERSLKIKSSEELKPGPLIKLQQLESFTKKELNAVDDLRKIENAVYHRPLALMKRNTYCSPNLIDAEIKELELRQLIESCTLKGSEETMYNIVYIFREKCFRLSFKLFSGSPLADKRWYTYCSPDECIDEWELRQFIKLCTLKGSDETMNILTAFVCDEDLISPNYGFPVRLRDLRMRGSGHVLCRSIRRIICDLSHMIEETDEEIEHFFRGIKI